MVKLRNWIIGAAVCIAAIPAIAFAQRAIVAGEPITPDGTYCNIAGFPVTVGNNQPVTLTAATTCGLFVRGLMYYSSNNNIISPLGSIALAPGGNNGANNVAFGVFEGTNLATNVSVNTVIKATAGRFYKISVITAGSTAGAVHDSSSTAGATAANQVATIPNTVGVYSYNFPMNSGITYIAGTGQVVVISYN